MNVIINDFNIYYEQHGIGKKEIVILPGWGDTRKTFYNMIDSLKEHYTIYIIDYPGFGNSLFPTRNLTIYDYAKLIKDFFNMLNIRNHIIIAHSFGSRISILLSTILNTSIEKLIIIDGQV